MLENIWFEWWQKIYIQIQYFTFFLLFLITINFIFKFYYAYPLAHTNFYFRFFFFVKKEKIHIFYSSHVILCFWFFTCIIFFFIGTRNDVLLTHSCGYTHKIHGNFTMIIMVISPDFTKWRKKQNFTVSFNFNHKLSKV
jgi:hypothetical protein